MRPTECPECKKSLTVESFLHTYEPEWINGITSCPHCLASVREHPKVWPGWDHVENFDAEEYKRQMVCTPVSLDLETTKLTTISAELLGQHMMKESFKEAFRRVIEEPHADINGVIIEGPSTLAQRLIEEKSRKLTYSRFPVVEYDFAEAERRLAHELHRGRTRLFSSPRTFYTGDIVV